MRPSFDDKKPIFLQVKEMIADAIIDGSLQEEAQAPSTNQLALHYKINPATILKGINQLVDDGILYKKRGIGMFVTSGAREKLLLHRRRLFKEEHVANLMKEAEKLDLSIDDIHDMMMTLKGRDDA
ncbi:GntR family transcriptional regulator [Shouchella lonarensis]|uniref:Transcriptional regulator, GntR family n=1 Tax=Shouchella lonarensis TaxID=1464122 RepID=A0A1G6IPV8_9BACI|nr:GntR family transcriptional regulator [Shouchella lonarensis]SDC08524.1 transcriptional regulator, GntR family [Shouchella lonarensis]